MYRELPEPVPEIAEGRPECVRTSCAENLTDIALFQLRIELLLMDALFDEPVHKVNAYMQRFGIQCFTGGEEECFQFVEAYLIVSLLPKFLCLFLTADMQCF